MLALKLLLLSVVVWSLLTVLQALAILNSLTCEYNKNVTINGHCELLAIRDRFAYISGGVYIPRPLTNLIISMELLRQKNNKFEPFLYRLQQDICNLNNVSRQMFTANRLFGIKKNVVRNMECPWQGNITTKFPCGFDKMRALLPVANYIVTGRIYNKELEVVNFNLSFTMK